jgi:hypothetical protein
VRCYSCFSILKAKINFRCTWFKVTDLTFLKTLAVTQSCTTHYQHISLLYVARASGCNLILLLWFVESSPFAIPKYLTLSYSNDPPFLLDPSRPVRPANFFECIHVRQSLSPSCHACHNRHDVYHTTRSVFDLYR